MFKNVSKRSWLFRGGWTIMITVGLVAPAFVETYWVQLGAVIFATAVGAIGLMLVFGRAGQLSLGHAFFLAIGAYSYVCLASPVDGSLLGAGLPPLLALLIAVTIAAGAGLILSPLAARLKGLSLGLATLSLNFIGVWLLHTVVALTGGYNGRSVPPLSVGAFSSAGSDVAIFGMQITAQRFLWYVGAIALIVVVLFVHNILRGRAGRAFTAIRDADIHAGALGVDVGRTRAAAFILSSAIAGLGGVLLAINIHRVVPEYWGFILSLSYLAMIVIGGMRSVGGAVLGAAFVAALPTIFQRYGAAIPGVGAEGGDGLGPSVAAQIIYGVAIIGVLLLQPEGMAHLLRSAFNRLSGGASSRPNDGDGSGVTHGLADGIEQKHATPAEAAVESGPLRGG